MAADALVIVLFSLSLVLLVCVLRASQLAASCRIRNWSFRSWLAGLLVDAAGAGLILAMSVSAPLFLLSVVIAGLDILWALPMVLLLAMNALSVFLLRQSATLRRERVA